MANGRDDLRLALGWVDHIKTTRLVMDLGADAALGLLRLWSYAATNHPQGVIGSPEDVEAIARWTGKPGELLAALKRLRWIEKDGVTLHDWPEEQPWVCGREARVQAAKVSGREGGLRSAASRKAKGTLDGTLDQPSREALADPQPPSPLLSSPLLSDSKEKTQSARASGSEPSPAGLGARALKARTGPRIDCQACAKNGDSRPAVGEATLGTDRPPSPLCERHLDNAIRAAGGAFYTSIAPGEPASQEELQAVLARTPFGRQHQPTSAPPVLPPT